MLGHFFDGVPFFWTVECEWFLHLGTHFDLFLHGPVGVGNVGGNVLGSVVPVVAMVRNWETSNTLPATLVRAIHDGHRTRPCRDLVGRRFLIVCYGC